VITVKLDIDPVLALEVASVFQEEGLTASWETDRQRRRRISSSRKKDGSVSGKKAGSSGNKAASAKKEGGSPRPKNAVVISHCKNAAAPEVLVHLFFYLRDNAEAGVVGGAAFAAAQSALRKVRERFPGVSAELVKGDEGGGLDPNRLSGVEEQNRILAGERQRLLQEVGEQREYDARAWERNRHEELVAILRREEQLRGAIVEGL
jgi:hypothetical protein